MDKISKISIIIPTYNEAGNIASLIDRLEKILSEVTEVEVNKVSEINKNKTNEINKIENEIIVIDDSSPDGTSKIIEKLARKYSNLQLIKREKKFGLGSAYQKGVSVSSGDIIVTMDADLSHDPRVIKEFIKKISEGYEVVIGSRYIYRGSIVGWNLYRKMISRLANIIARLLLGLKIRDVTSGYRCYTKKAIEKIGFSKIKSSGYSFLLESVFIAERVGLKCL